MHVATQGINPWDLVAVFRAYLQLILNLDARQVRMWWADGRPHLQGESLFSWFRIVKDNPSKSLGPGRWGNRSDIRFEVHLLTRTMLDESQVDERKAKDFYEAYWKLEQSFAGLNLFNQYSAPPTSGLWFPPQPLPTAVPYTIEPMYVEELPKPDKTQKEEATSDATFVVIAPVVLALTVP